MEVSWVRGWSGLVLGGQCKGEWSVWGLSRVMNDRSGHPTSRNDPSGYPSGYPPVNNDRSDHPTVRND